MEKQALYESLCSHLATVLPTLGHNPVRIELLAGDASSRRYARILEADGRSVMCMVYPNPAAGEERSFLDVQSFFARLGLPVPEVYAVYPEHGILLVQDLGDNLLETVVEQVSEARRRELYLEAVELLIQLRHVTAGMQSGCGAFYLAFDKPKLMQEMQFFLTHFCRGLCRIQPSPAASRSLQQFFDILCTILAEEPRIIAHRDYHARNLLLYDGKLFIIDFQDARMGPAQYDLASLLRDSYVTLPSTLVDSILDHYVHSVRPSPNGPQYFRYIFDLMALQRNIKALGTFGYQVSVRGSTRYLSAIPRTGRYIRDTMEHHPELMPFASVLEDYVWGPASDFTETAAAGLSFMHHARCREQ